MNPPPVAADAVEARAEQLRWVIQPILDRLGDHPVLQAIVVVLAGLLVALLVTWLLSAVLHRLAKKTDFDFDDQLIRLLRPPLFYTLLLVGLLIALNLAELPEEWTGIARLVLKSISILIWAVFFSRFLRLVVRSLAERPDRAGLISLHTMPLFVNLASALVIVIAVYLLFNAWGIDMTAWLASAGVVGIAVGFAAKDTLANFISGIFILTDAPYKIGDYIVLDSGERGEVTHIGVRSTRILTRDDVELTIPNSVMGNSKIINESGGPYTKYRIRMPVGAAYGSDIDQIRRVLLDVAAGNDDVVGAPAPRVRFRAFGASSLDFELLCWVNDPRLRGRAIDSLLEQTYKAFNREGIEIPFAKQDIYIKELPEN